jgi:hypothetical protein
MTRYRLILMPKREARGPWRDTSREAKEDAIAAGLGSRDEHVPERIYLDALAEIETSAD